jgi:serine phosphatase RsbU (regulator of sigma subunit)
MSIFKKLRSEANSIKWQFTIRSWLILFPCFVIGNVSIYLLAVKLMEQSIHNRLKSESQLLDFAIQRWDKGSRDQIKLFSELPEVRMAAEKRDKSYSASLFSKLTKFTTYKSWRLWTTDGDLVDYTTHADLKINPQTAKEKIKKSNFFVKAITKNEPTFDIQNSVISGLPCIEAAYPIYSENPTKIGTKTVGVLNYCLDLNLIGEDSGLDDLYKTLSSGMYDMVFTKKDILFNIYTNIFNLGSLDQSSVSKFVLLTESGHLIFPIDDDPQKSTVDQEKLPIFTVNNAKKEGWQELIELAAKDEVNFQKIRINGTDYYAFKSTIDDIWTSFTLIDSKVFLLGLGFFLYRIIVLQIITLFVIAIGMYWQARKISGPLNLASTSIKQISNGQFDINIIHNRSDEIGALYDDINSTAVQLRDFINEATANAVTNKQLETANRIQKNFLVEKLSESNFYELAATFVPAYEIGADWYDAISIDDKLYFVIADVCDKGVASALFMSVFRTLIRYTLLNYNSELNSQCDQVLVNVISMVNNYMATTHEKATMFATVFMASYSHKDNSLSYVCAGHELPIVIRSEGLEVLKPTGPAIGLFPEAKFNVNQINFNPGDVIFSYTDGLTDARSPENISWGIENLKNAIKAEDHNTCSAQDLLSNIANKSFKHIDTAEQFDDLTIFVLKANNSQ